MTLRLCLCFSSLLSIWNPNKVNSSSQIKLISCFLNIIFKPRYFAEFSKISGIECNIEKTKVVPIGDFDKENKIGHDIKLVWEDDFTLLGFYINNKLENLKQNLWVINTRVKNLINRWKLYYLTIHGRFTVVKSILLAQYTYVGSIMDIIDEDDMNNIQQVMNHFWSIMNCSLALKKDGFRECYVCTYTKEVVI